jgi:glycerol kinase
MSGSRRSATSPSFTAASEIISSRRSTASWAALFGQTCFAEGEGKCACGTGNFLLVNTGERVVASSHGLLSSVAYRVREAPAVYALLGLDRGYRAQWKRGREWRPAMAATERETRYALWRKAVIRTRD